MKEFRSIFKQDFADYIETNQGTISNDTLRNTRSVLLTFDVNSGILQFQKKKCTHSERLYKILVHHWVF